MLKKGPFMWGTATASFQVEGGVNEGGRGPTIWDAFCRIPGRVRHQDNGDVACDSYHRYKEDVALVKGLGANTYRFSIAWARIQPTGRGPANPEGIAYYNRLIDELLANGITPFVTLYHWDLPLDLQMAHDGWLNPSIIQDFVNYAKICFDAFGDRVKHWLTFNEPWCVCLQGYGTGGHAPGRKGLNEPYQAGHNLLLAHAYTVKLFREGGYDGAIGITNNTTWHQPLTQSPEDVAAAERANQFSFGWFTAPVVYGDYPAVMKEYLGIALPEFTPGEKELLKGSIDFIGLNHYMTSKASLAPADASLAGRSDVYARQNLYISADPAWKRTQINWTIVPEGFRELLCWIRDRFQNPPIVVTENGCADEGLEDNIRCDYLKTYIDAMLRARDEDKVDIRGYLCWSLMDNFEWAFGYDMTFGLVACSPKDTTRRPKKSYYLYKEIISANSR